MSHDSICGINMLNWSLSCEVNVLRRSTMNSVQHYVHPEQQVPTQRVDTTCDLNMLSWSLSYEVNVLFRSQ